MTTVRANGAIRLSAIVPNYNHAALIEKAVRAPAAQVPPRDEIIVVDDVNCAIRIRRSRCTTCEPDQPLRRKRWRTIDIVWK
jgi:D-tyrosyl-tRNA(Tyr) deacylase